MGAPRVVGQPYIGPVERPTSRPPALLPVVLLVGVLGISTSGPLARLAASPPLTIAFWRLTIALAWIVGCLVWTGEWRSVRTLARRDLVWAGVSGVMLALHFWSWIASLDLTTVAASVVLVNLHPLVIVTGSALLLGERPSRAQAVGLALAIDRKSVV